jgi:hypothetical protein
VTAARTDSRRGSARPLFAAALAVVLVLFALVFLVDVLGVG